MLDIAELYQFYASPLGHSVSALLQQRLRAALWPKLSGQRLCGYGYALPLLEPYVADNTVLALMPAAQGVISWPRGAAPRTVLTDEHRWPLSDSSVDALILLHALEHAEVARQTLREAWRVLRGDGRLLVVVPNRLSIWARREVSPFAAGKPYTLTQCRALLQQSMFTPLQHTAALVWPPCRNETLLSLAPYVDTYGAGLLGSVGGVLMIEAAKQIYAPTFQGGSPVRLRRAGDIAAARPAPASRA